MDTLERLRRAVKTEKPFLSAGDAYEGMFNDDKVFTDSCKDLSTRYCAFAGKRGSPGLVVPDAAGDATHETYPARTVWFPAVAGIQQTHAIVTGNPRPPQSAEPPRRGRKRELNPNVERPKPSEDTDADADDDDEWKKQAGEGFLEW